MAKRKPRKRAPWKPVISKIPVVMHNHKLHFDLHFLLGKRGHLYETSFKSDLIAPRSGVFPQTFIHVLKGRTLSERVFRVSPFRSADSRTEVFSLRDNGLNEEGKEVRADWFEGGDVLIIIGHEWPIPKEGSSKRRR